MTGSADYERAKQAHLRSLDASSGRIHVVFAQGKTGTSAIAAAIKRAGVAPVLQLHTMLRLVLERTEADFLLHQPQARPRHVWDAQWLRSHPPTADRPWLIVTSVRDPIARLVSTFFQRSGSFGTLADRTETSDVIARINERLDLELTRLDDPYWDWFEVELRPLLGVSVYDTPFEASAGYSIIETEHAQAVLLRRESLSAGREAIARLLGRDIVLRNENVGSEKDYGPLYRAVLDELRAPTDLVDKVYATRLARHFYSQRELDGFQRYWTRPRVTPSR